MVRADRAGHRPVLTYVTHDLTFVENEPDDQGGRTNIDNMTAVDGRPDRVFSTDIRSHASA